MRFALGVDQCRTAPGSVFVDLRKDVLTWGRYLVAFFCSAVFVKVLIEE